MSLPTVTQHLNALLEDGLIEQCGQLQSQIGRKATAYSIVSDVRVGIGVEILKNRVTIASVDLYGTLITYKRVRILFENTDFYYQTICDEIKTYIKEQNFEEEQILGINFAMPGLVSSDHTHMTYSKILPLDNVTTDTFAQYLPYPCNLWHDSECAAANVLWRNPEIDTAIYLNLSVHLGGAIIIDGEIQQGRLGKSGTMEHMTLHPHGKKCYCGQSGCADCYCSSHTFLEEDEDLENFFESKKNGDLKRQALWREFLNNLAHFINNIHLVIDSFVILGGHIAPFIEEEDLVYLHKEMKETTAFPESEPFVLPGSRMPHEIPIGAALGYVKSFLESI